MSSTTSSGTAVPGAVIVGGATVVKSTNSTRCKNLANFSTGLVGALVALTVVCALYNAG